MPWHFCVRCNGAGWQPAFRLKGGGDDIERLVQIAFTDELFPI
jgi:hypothetical protein